MLPLPLLYLVGLSYVIIFSVKEEHWLLAFQILGFAYLAVYVVIFLGKTINYLLTHKPCPECSEERIRAIRRVMCGYDDDGEFHTTFTLFRDAKGDLYTRRYNRICRTCGHKYYVKDGRIPPDLPQGEPKFQMSRNMLDDMRKECAENQTIKK